MIVTVRLTKETMRTLTVPFTAGSFHTDEELLADINLSVREQIWAEFTNQDKIYYPQCFDSLKAPAIVMIFNGGHCDY